MKPSKRKEAFTLAETLAHGHQKRDAVMDKKSFVGANGKSPVGFPRAKTKVGVCPPFRATTTLQPLVG